MSQYDDIDEIMQRERERDAAILENNAKWDKRNSPRAKKLAAIREASREIEREFGMVPIVHVPTNTLFRSKTFAARSLLMAEISVSNKLVSGEFRVATREEAAGCKAEADAAQKVKPKPLSEHNKRVQADALKRRKMEAGRSRYEAWKEQSSKPVVRRSDGRLFESIADAAKQLGISKYFVRQGIKLGDYITLTPDQAKAYKKEQQ